MGSKARAWLVILLFVCLSLSYNCSQASHFDFSREEESELEEQLKLLNKPPITTFQTKEGDIIDCVDINKQPALDHPSLKNHKVQTRPSTYPFGLSKDSSSSNDNSLINNNNRACPIGYVPIRRTLKKDLIRIRRSLPSKQPIGIKASTLDAVNFPYNQNVSKQPTGIKASTLGAVNFPYNQNVVSLALKRGVKYYGASTGGVSVYNLSVAQDQSSSSNIWIVGGPPGALNVILAGWQVNPKINGDSRTRMFVYWTDRSSGNWWLAVSNSHATIGYWLAVSNSHATIGYWPKELFGHLNDGAEQVAWGGMAKPSPNGMSPPLGNGHKPNGKYDEACYFKSINYIDDNNSGVDPAYENTVSYVSNSNCYNLYHGSTCGVDNMYYCFTFGGPGGYNCRAT